MAQLVLLPGMDGTGDLFAPFTAALGAGVPVRVVRYPVCEVLGYRDLASVARGALPKDGPFVLLGESFSGPVAVSLAADNPAGLIGLVLVGRFVRAPRRVPPVLADLMASMPAIQPPVGLLAPFLLGRSAPPALREALGRALVAVSPPVLRARLAAVLSVDVSAEIAAVRVPVLVLRASRDRVVPKSATDLAARLCPRARKLVLPGPHLLLMAAPAESARVVAAFLDEVGNPG